jgi:glycine cleavage system H protein
MRHIFSHGAMDKQIRVSADHVWVGIEDEHVHLGLTNFVQRELGAVVSVELPEIGDKMESGEVFAEIEFVSTVHELIAPVSGTVLAVNTALEEHPTIINEDPYSEGWLVEVRIKDESEIDSLMDIDEYYHFVFKDNG